MRVAHVRWRKAVSDEDLFDFYNSVIPNTVTSVADLAKWWKSKHDEQPDLLDFDPEKVERLADAESVSLADYPDHWHTLVRTAPLSICG